MGGAFVTLRGKTASEVRRKVAQRLNEARNMGLCEEGRTELAYRPKTREWSISMYLHT